MKLTQKNKTIIAIALFIVIFTALVLIASFLDLQISQLLTKGTLEKGEYFANDFFGVFLECVGCIPIYLMIAFALCVLFWSGLKLLRKRNNALGIALAVVCGIGVVAVCWYTVKDIMGYVFEHTAYWSQVESLSANEGLHKFEHSAVMFCIEAVIGALIAVPSVFATKLLSEETLKKLLRFIFATAIALLVANVLIMIIKDPVGRMRFRAINSELGSGLIDAHQVQGYTPWYISNGQPDDAILNSFERIYGVSDAFKSFPSGHTCSAGTVYALIMIPDLFELKNKKAAKLACWIAPIVYTALVAISRIMVGAHYMSDVTFGGTIVFVCVILLREIVVLKGRNFFSIFPKKQSQAQAGNAGSDAAITVEDESVDATQTNSYEVDNSGTYEGLNAEKAEGSAEASESEVESEPSENNGAV